MDSRLEELLTHGVSARFRHFDRFEQYEGADIFFPDSDSRDVGYLKYREYCRRLGMKIPPTLVAVDEMLPYGSESKAPEGRYNDLGDVVVISKKLFNDFRKEYLPAGIVVGHELGHGHYTRFSRRRLMAMVVAGAAVGSTLGTATDAAFDRATASAAKDGPQDGGKSLAISAGTTTAAGIGIVTAASVIGGLLRHSKNNKTFIEESYAERKAAEILGAKKVFLNNWAIACRVMFPDQTELANVRHEFMHRQTSKPSSVRRNFETMSADDREVAFGLHVLREYRQIAVERASYGDDPDYPSSVGRCLALAQDAARELSGTSSLFFSR